MNCNEPRTRLLPKMLECEVEEYLSGNDIIIVPVGTVEPHGGFPLDSGTVLNEAFAKCMAESCNGLYLPGIPYFYSGATATGVGATQINITQGVAYLKALAHSLFRQGFKRQIYVSCHGPTLLTCSTVIREFFDETGVPILYIDMMKKIWDSPSEFKSRLYEFYDILVGGYAIIGRLDEVPLTTEHWHQTPNELSKFAWLSGMAAQNGAVGYYFAKPSDHLATPPIATEEKRLEMSERGCKLIRKAVANLEMQKTVDDLRSLEVFTKRIMSEYPNVPAAYNTKTIFGKKEKEPYE